MKVDEALEVTVEGEQFARAAIEADCRDLRVVHHGAGHVCAEYEALESAPVARRFGEQFESGDRIHSRI